jgi:hypothetical protein
MLITKSSVVDLPITHSNISIEEYMQLIEDCDNLDVIFVQHGMKNAKTRQSIGGFQGGVLRISNLPSGATNILFTPDQGPAQNSNKTIPYAHRCSLDFKPSGFNRSLISFVPDTDMNREILASVLKNKVLPYFVYKKFQDNYSEIMKDLNERYEKNWKKKKISSIPVSDSNADILMANKELEKQLKAARLVNDILVKPEIVSTFTKKAVENIIADSNNATKIEKLKKENPRFRETKKFKEMFQAQIAAEKTRLIHEHVKK